MFASARPMAALFLSYGLLVLGNGLFTTLLSLRARLEGYSTETVGWLMASYFLGMFLGARYAASVVHRAGHIRAFAAFASLVSVSPLLHILWVDPLVWMVIRLVDGYCLAGLFMVTESWLNARAENHNRGSILALYMVVNFTASGLAQLMLPWADPGGFRLFALASVFFSTALLPLLLTRASAPGLEGTTRLSIRPLLRKAPAGFWGAVCSGSANAAFFGLAPVFAQDLRMSLEQISLFMAAGITGGLLLQIPLGKLSDRVERRLVIASVALASLSCSGFLVLLVRHGADYLWFYLAVFLYGSLAFTLYSLASAHANDWTDTNCRVQTSAGLLAGYCVGAVIGPLAASTLMGQLGPSGLFVYAGGNYLLMMLYALRQSAVAGQAPEKVEFIPQPAVQVVSEELYQAVQEEVEPVPEPTGASPTAP